MFSFYQLLAAFALGLLLTNVIYNLAFGPSSKRRLDILLEEKYRKKVRSRLENGKQSKDKTSDSDR